MGPDKSNCFRGICQTKGLPGLADCMQAQAEGGPLLHALCLLRPASHEASYPGDPPTSEKQQNPKIASSKFSLPLKGPGGWAWKLLVGTGSFKGWTL